MSLPERRSRHARTRTAPARVACTLAAAVAIGGWLAGSAGSPALASTALASTALASTAPASTAPAHPKVVWAMTATGHRIRLPKPKFTPTPVHPEKITHPGRDYMGAVTAAHLPPGTGRGPDAAVPQLPGIDVSSYQGDIDWASVAPYIDFSYAKATEGTYYTNPDFDNQYEGPYDYGVIRGAYHFAIPDNSSGEAQADYFIDNGGGWSGDGLTLPGALDIEYNPYGSECYGLTQSQMVAWVKDFVAEYAYREGVYPVIYSTTDWWSTCTGNSSAFASLDPLWIANYTASGGGPLPAGWGVYTFWQYADSGSLPGDQDVFNGAYSQLQVLAKKG
jgi:GH25 family lysozyme M1 (1,4-beta-N-acetylmuramidase)